MQFTPHEAGERTRREHEGQLDEAVIPAKPVDLRERDEQCGQRDREQHCARQVERPARDRAIFVTGDEQIRHHEPGKPNRDTE